MSAINKIVAVILISVALHTMAQTPGNRVRIAVCGVNSAASAVLDTVGISRGYVRVNNSRNGDASLVQAGTGEYMLTLGAESWLPVDSMQTVWGHASYTTGHRRNVRWANAVDIDRVGPYIIGDGVGGDLSSQIYDFGGGYARRVGRRITVGASLHYRAEIDYRQRDPRLRAVVSDLDFSAGVSYAFGNDMLVAAGLSYNLYNQDDDVDFYSVNNSVRVYPLTGLGTTYSRFSGISGDFSTAYKGNGWGVNIALLPAKCSVDRITLVFAMSNDNTNLIMRGYNNLNLTELQHKSYSLSVSRPFNFRSIKMTPYATAHIDNYIGTENLFGSAVGNIYEQIGSRQTYKRYTVATDAGINLLVPVSDKMSFDIVPSVSYISQCEKMTAEDRELGFRVIIPSVDLSWYEKWSGLWSSSFGIGLAYKLADVAEERLPGLDKNDPIGAMVVSDFSYLTSDVFSCGTSISVTRKLKSKLSLGVTVGYTIASVSDHHTRNELLSSIFVNF